VTGDATPLGIVDLGGNVAEETRDVLASLGSSCGLAASFIERVCAFRGAPNVAARGGGWISVPSDTLVTSRRSAPHNNFSSGLGFRCVRAGTDAQASRSQRRAPASARTDGPLLRVLSGAGPASARGQIVLHVDTDAPLPEPGGAASNDPMIPAPLFDRLRIDVYPPGESDPCRGCSEDFAVDAPMLRETRASLGLVPVVGQSGWRARARLFLQRFARGGEPDPGSTIDVSVELPPVALDGIVDVAMMLPTDAVGQPVALDDAPAARVGRLTTSAVGTWAGAQRVDCQTARQPGEVCVPGGAFWMGSAGDHYVPGAAPGWHRLVVLSPFFLDAREMTVAQARAAGANQTGLPTWSGSVSGTSTADWCTYTSRPGPRDSLPVTCITWNMARQLCQQRGADLPTEAQFEYVHGALRGALYPWGSDAPACDDDIWGRAGFGLLSRSNPRV
jgi:formylglycine-generating enzyme required for sulfatase activity